MHSRGLLVAFLSAEKLAEHRENLDIAKRFGLDPRVLVGDAVREQKSFLSDAVHGGFTSPSTDTSTPRPS